LAAPGGAVIVVDIKQLFQKCSTSIITATELNRKSSPEIVSVEAKPSAQEASVLRRRKIGYVVTSNRGRGHLAPGDVGASSQPQEHGDLEKKRLEVLAIKTGSPMVSSRDGSIAITSSSA
jgi:hypothetical protein